MPALCLQLLRACVARCGAGLLRVDSPGLPLALCLQLLLAVVAGIGAEFLCGLAHASCLLFPYSSCSHFVARIQAGLLSEPAHVSSLV